jgi:hypothetical protein
VALTVAVVEVDTVPACTVTVPVVLPDGTVTLLGTGKAVLLLELRATCTPAPGAGPLRVTVRVVNVPLGAVEGAMTMLLTDGSAVVKL